ncbi:hypothetical protein ACFFGV_16380 [Pontibacillus salicampi]|uniref:DUF695 domain-containing protein n=1 Tax=Pontibacillus salicampi TaxID=1449801 RepID=A0ABV6LRW6_9BACI
MTQYIYIASPVKLPQGCFGHTPISAETPNVFNSEFDYTHLYFENNYDSIIKRKFTYSPHFTYNYQVAAAANDIPLKSCIKGTREEEKCLELLYSYITEAMKASGTLQYFTCVSGKEDSERLIQRKVNWNDLQEPYDLVLDDREYWEITF